MVESSRRSESDDEDTSKLTKEECELIDLAFNVFDKDNSGSINVKELLVIIEMMGQKMNAESIYKMIAEASPENSGEISRE